jgi:hypothetical protein
MEIDPYPTQLTCSRRCSWPGWRVWWVGVLVRVLVSAAMTLLRSGVLVVGDGVLPVPVGGCATVSGGRGRHPESWADL